MTRSTGPSARTVIRIASSAGTCTTSVGTTTTRLARRTTAMDSTRARIARDYIDRGWIPFAYAGEKLPPYGWQNTTVDAGTVDRIARNTFPVGILTGKPSNLVVVDIDKQNGGDFDALVSRYGKENLFTYVVATPSGGWHLYYRYPEGVEKLTKVIKTGRGIPELRGIDLLADGCHVIAPPTVRVGDGRKAPGEYKVVQNVDVAELPKQLLEDWLRSEERRVGKESMCGWQPHQE